MSAFDDGNMQNESDVEMQKGGTRSVGISTVSTVHKGLDLISTISYCLFGGTIVLCLVAIGLHHRSTIVRIAFAISIAVSSYGLFQRWKLDRMDSLREALNEIRQEVNRMMTENDKLTRNNDELEVQANRVKDMESSLNGILSSQGKNVTAFVSLVKENRVILDEMKQALKAQVSQDLLQLIFAADRDEDFVIDPEEVRGLLFRLRAFDGLDVNEEHFRSLLEKKGNSISAVVGLVTDLLDDEPNDDTVFTVDPKRMARHA
uniref:EF-hand domain-containing protein n=2 Tax=Ditylum brightwellii TaxID=49249 RepID=A0A6V2CCS8_9STRA|mmetsp:Transcript_32422/g.47280  ORF Transcript_32422/g.47280 Transcript_32422/m.47280 type:complete len:261 (+) Transcript_32422:60-842(+)